MDIDATRAVWRQRREEWIQRIGPLLTAAQVEHLRVSVDSRVNSRNHVIHIQIDDEIRFPALQFQKDGTLCDWVTPVATALRDPDTVLQFLGSARPILSGKSYAELILAGQSSRALTNQIVDDANRIAAAESR